MAEAGKPVFLWAKGDDSQPAAVLEVSERSETIQPMGGHEGTWDIVNSREHVAAGAIAVSFRDEDLVWVSDRPIARRNAVQHFDEFEGARARVLIDRGYGAAYGSSANAIDGRDFSIVSGYAVIALYLRKHELVKRPGIVLVRAAEFHGTVATSITIAVPIGANGHFGKFHVFRSSHLEDVVVRLASERVGETPVGTDVLATIGAREITAYAQALPPYPSEPEILGRSLSSWGRLFTIGSAGLAVAIGLVAAGVYWKSLMDRAAAEQRQAKASEIAAKSRQIVDSATWALSQRSSADVAAVMASAEAAWRPLTRVSVSADATKSTITVIARRTFESFGAVMENPLASDAQQLRTLFVPPVIPGLTLSRSQVTPDLNEISYEYSLATPHRIDRASDR